MIERIQILCFAASYGVALALEISRLGFRSAVRGVLLWGFSVAGFLAQTLYLWHRTRLADGPLSSPFDWYLLAAWLLVLAYLVLAYWRPASAIGLFLLPLVLGLIVVAALLADRTPLAVNRATRAWGALHGGFLLFGTVAVFIGFATGVMYLVHAYRLKHKLPQRRGLQLPSLEWLERVNSRAISLAIVMLLLGVISGAVLNTVRPELPWSDPIVVSSLVTVAWLVIVTLFVVVYRPARQGRKVAYLTVASFLFLVFSLGAALVLNTKHAGLPEQPTDPARAARSAPLEFERRGAA
ncbi:MAG: cytochrome c biogenesis protein [Pirellulales bacterium]|nr:cytochrome c biogenesis protein [Pirellulales bacterium]